MRTLAAQSTVRLVVDILCKAPFFGWVVGWMGNMQVFVIAFWFNVLAFF